MKKITFLIFLLSLISFLKAQEALKIDYSEIKVKIQDKNSSSYYPKLLQRFNDFDNTLTTEDYALIYYGFSFQDDYLKNQPDERALNKLQKEENFEGQILESKKILAVNPVSLTANDCMAYALFKTGHPETEWKKYQDRFRAIRRVIASSGNGMTCESAYKVIYVSDEYNMIYTYFNVEKVHSQKLSGLCDKFDVDPTEYLPSKVVFFDISRKLLRQEELRK
ncbi:DUF4919 domain-containing protein [Sphingobacterium sp. SG20118]|uniref:DUF4919 domain-containing protein n=1 Tax=Sphingobacterium sp. SG20118 TaxID=3367156 RepID=UPI0037DFC9D4